MSSDVHFGHADLASPFKITTLGLSVAPVDVDPAELYPQTESEG